MSRVLAAAAVLAALAQPVPATAAGHHTGGCSFRAVQQADITGDRYEGFAYGYVAGDADDEVAVWCEVRVNGATAARTPAGSGTAAAYTAGLVSYLAGDTDSVQSCWIVTLDGVTEETCRWVGQEMWWPPGHGHPGYWVAMVVDEVFRTVDAATCPLLAARTGTYGRVYVNEQGDVFLDGEPQWDCPPYDQWPPA